MGNIVRMDDKTTKRMKEFLERVYPWMTHYGDTKHFFGYMSYNDSLNAVLDHAEQFIKEGRVIK